MSCIDILCRTFGSKLILEKLYLELEGVKLTRHVLAENLKSQIAAKCTI